MDGRSDAPSSSASVATPLDEDTLVGLVVRLIRGDAHWTSEVRTRVREGRGVLLRGVLYSAEVLRKALDQIDAISGVGDDLGCAVLAGDDATSVPEPPLKAPRLGDATSSVPVVEAPVSMVEKGPTSVGDEGSIVAGHATSAPMMDRFLFCPHGPYLNVSWNAQMLRWELVHRMLRLRAPLPASPYGWDVSVEDDGSTIIFELSPESTAVFEASDFFKHDIFKREPSGELMIRSQLDSGQVARQSFQHMQAQHKYGTAKLKIGETSAQDCLDVAVFSMPRDGNKIWWSILSMTSALQFRRSKDNEGKFVQKYIQSWNRWLGQCELHAVLRSVPYARREGGALAEDRVLRFISISTTGLLALFARWVAGRRYCGQLKTPEERSLVVRVFSVLTQVAYAGGGARMRLFFASLSPRQAGEVPVAGSDPLDLHIDAQGMVDLSLLREVRPSRPGSHVPPFVFKLISHFNAAKCPLHELVFWSLDQGGKMYFHIFKQIIWHLGELLDDHLCNSTCEKGSVELNEDQYQEVDTEQLLAQYWQGAADAASRMPLLHLSCAVDKSKVHSYACFVGAYCLPDGIAWWGVPQDRYP